MDFFGQNHLHFIHPFWLTCSKIFASWSRLNCHARLKKCGMGPLLVLVSPCFRENVGVTCKIGSFLCSLDNLFQKNVNVFFFGNEISKWRSFEKERLFFTYFSHFFSYQGKVTNFLQHISHSHTYIYLLTFFALPILKNTNLSGMVALWYDSWC